MVKSVSIPATDITPERIRTDASLKGYAVTRVADSDRAVSQPLCLPPPPSALRQAETHRVCSTPTCLRRRHGVARRSDALTPFRQNPDRSPVSRFLRSGSYAFHSGHQRSFLPLRSRNLYSTMPSDWSIPILSRNLYLRIHFVLTLGKPFFR